MFLFIYLLIGVICLGIAAYLNFTHKWITKEDVRCDGGVTAFFLIGLTVVWPLTLIIVGIQQSWKYISENAFPDDDK